MNRREALGRAGRAGEEILRARVAVYAGLVTAALLGFVALLVVIVLALAGAGPGLGWSVLIVLVAAVLGGGLARAVVLRVSLLTVAAFAARRLGRRGR